ncbi:hypothetical protein RB595_008836 [Gaeumannomyces hyphopodioides]
MRELGRESTRKSRTHLFRKDAKMAIQAASSGQDDTSSSIKNEKRALGLAQHAGAPGKDEEVGESKEVFRFDADGVKFRTVSWQRATVVFLKINFAMSILAIPGALASLGAVGGAIIIVATTALNTYTGTILGDFYNKHPECHTLADMMEFLWGPIGRELVGIQIVICQVLISASGIVTTATAFNALTNHGTCTVTFAFVSTFLITACSSIRTFSRLGWLTWFGFCTFVLSVFVFTVAVGRQDRPAGAPPTGDFDLGWVAVAHPTFVVGMVSTANIFISTCGSSNYLLVISEMRNPRDYKKACILSGIIVGAMYLTFSVVIYRYCGVWLSIPAFGSAGELFKKVSYGIALPGLIVGVGIYQHVAAKYAFVRTLRDSKHLQTNTLVHWGTWLGINVALGTVGFVVAEAVPILNYLLGIAAALGLAPFSLMYPAMLWWHDYDGSNSRSAVRNIKMASHVFIFLFGLFMLVAGTYSVATVIKDAFASGEIPGVFDCRDNSGSS